MTKRTVLAPVRREGKGLPPIQGLHRDPDRGGFSEKEWEGYRGTFVRPNDPRSRKRIREDDELHRHQQILKGRQKEGLG